VKTLNDLNDGQIAKIGSYKRAQGVSRRLMELGLMPGVTVRFIKSAPLGDPIALDVDGRQLSRFNKTNRNSRHQPQLHQTTRNPLSPLVRTNFCNLTVV
jgi:Fe2+ transport system protein FeoA